MKIRSSHTVSERELIDKMAASGRPVSLSQLARWRKEGLLPPFASHGLGTGRGKSYYWREPNILDHACATHDLLQKYRRPETVLWMLWLSGFSVPLPQFRRVWAHRGRARALRCAQRAVKLPLQSAHSQKLKSLPARGKGNNRWLFLEAVLAFAGALMLDEDDRAVISIIKQAVRPSFKINGMASAQDEERLWLVLRVMADTLAGSDLISITSDADLRQAQHYLVLAGSLLQTCDDRTSEGNPDKWPSWLAERMGEPVFLLIVLLLQSGRKAVLDDITNRLEKPSRRTIRGPARAAIPRSKV